MSRTILPHFDGKKFHNPADAAKPYTSSLKNLRDVIKWRWERRLIVARIKGVHIPWQTADVVLLHAPANRLRVTWLGHATVLVQHGNVNILTDPIFSQRCSPLAWLGPKRFTPPALQLSQLPPINYVVISHNHFDHLDLPTVKTLGGTVTWVVPMGLGRWFRRRGLHKVIELNWWQSYQTDSVKFTATPAQHWSRRTFRDSNTSLWASWAIEFGQTKFWFGGDTGYHPGMFKAIGQYFGGFTAAAIPIGAYEPRWFMKAYHVNPAEAVQIHQDIKSAWSVGVHWGTFRLTDEPIDEPPKKLQLALAEAELSTEQFETLAIGQTKNIS